MVEVDDGLEVGGGDVKGGERDGIDEAGDAATEIVNEGDGIGGEEFLLGAGAFEVMGEIELGVFPEKGLKAEKEGKALPQGFIDAEAEEFEEFGGAEEEDGEEVAGFALAVSEEADEIKGGMSDFLAFIEDEQAIDGGEIFEGGLEKADGGGFGKSRLEVKLVSEGMEHILFAEVGKGDIETAVGIGIKGFGEGGDERRFAGAGGSGEDGEAAALEESGE